MKQEDKELLLKDLCARLPYGVKCAIFDKELGFGGIPGFEGKYPFVIDGITQEGDDIDVWVERGNFSLEIVKPYLFPLSSMTEEQLKDLGTYYAKDSKNIIDDAIKSLESSLVMYKAAHVCFNTLEWYNKNHFDYRGLIEKGLAIDATGLNIY